MAGVDTVGHDGISPLYSAIKHKPYKNSQFRLETPPPKMNNRSIDSFSVVDQSNPSPTLEPSLTKFATFLDFVVRADENNDGSYNGKL